MNTDPATPVDTPAPSGQQDLVQDTTIHPEPIASEGNQSETVSQDPVSSGQGEDASVGIFGFGKGVGEGYVLETVEPTAILPEMKGKVLLVPALPSVHFMFKASAVGAEAVIAASSDLGKAEALGDEIAGKAQIGLLVVSEKMDLKKYEGKKLVVDGSKKMLGE